MFNYVANLFQGAGESVSDNLFVMLISSPHARLQEPMNCDHSYIQWISWSSTNTMHCEPALYFPKPSCCLVFVVTHLYLELVYYYYSFRRLRSEDSFSFWITLVVPNPLIVSGLV